MMNCVWLAQRCDERYRFVSKKRKIDKCDVKSYPITRGMMARLIADGRDFPRKNH